MPVKYLPKCNICLYCIIFYFFFGVYIIIFHCLFSVRTPAGHSIGLCSLQQACMFIT